MAVESEKDQEGCEEGRKKGGGEERHNMERKV